MGKQRQRRHPRSITSLSKASKAELLDFYKTAMLRLTAAITSTEVLSSARPRLAALINQTDAIIGKLDREVQAWIRAELPALYRGNVSFIGGQIRASGVDMDLVKRASKHAGIHQQAIQNLISNPLTGAGPRLMQVANKMKQDMRSFASSHRSLQKQLKATNRGLLDGMVQGSTNAQISNSIMSGIMGNRSKEWLGLQRFEAGSSTGGLALKTLADAPWLIKSDGSKLHIFDHVQMTVNTKASEIRNKARANALVERGIELGQISPNPPLTPDACALYAGRIVALTPASAKATGYPLVDRLPNGGPPFHPNCTHTLQAWMGDLEDAEDIAIAHEVGPGSGKTVRGGIPESALDKRWGDIQRGVNKDGFGSILKQNPQVARSIIPSTVGDKVRDAIEEHRKGGAGVVKGAKKRTKKKSDQRKSDFKNPSAKVEAPITSPVVKVDNFTSSEISSILDSGGKLDMGKVGFVKSQDLSVRVAQDEMLNSGIFGSKNKMKSLMDDFGYDSSSSSGFASMLIDIGKKSSRKTVTGFKASDLRKEFSSIAGSHTDILKSLRASLLELNGAPQALHRSIGSNYTSSAERAKKRFSKALDKDGHFRILGYKKHFWDVRDPKAIISNIESEIESAMSMIDSINIKALSFDHRDIKWRISSKARRANASAFKNEINIGVNHFSKGQAKVHLHELGHHLEYRSKNISDRFKAFVFKRADARGSRFINVHRNRKGVDAIEIGWEDDFFDEYVGRIYYGDNGIVMNPERSLRIKLRKSTLADVGDTEALSMGIEAFMDPKTFEKLLFNDPEHFSLIWSTLRGY